MKSLLNGPSLGFLTLMNIDRRRGDLEGICTHSDLTFSHRSIIEDGQVEVSTIVTSRLYMKL